MPILRRLSKWQWRDERSGRRFSPTNGKKWFPRGYKATAQNRCTERQMRKWFCESNSLDPVHPKQTTLPVLMDMTAWLFPNHNKKQIYPKLVARPPSSTNALKNVQLCCVCLDSLLHTQSEFSHNWPLPQPLRLAQQSLLWGAPPTVQGPCSVQLSNSCQEQPHCWFTLLFHNSVWYLRAETASQADKDPGTHGQRKACPPKSTAHNGEPLRSQQTERSHCGGTC